MVSCAQKLTLYFVANLSMTAVRSRPPRFAVHTSAGVLRLSAAELSSTAAYKCGVYSQIAGRHTAWRRQLSAFAAAESASADRLTIAVWLLGFGELAAGGYLLFGGRPAGAPWTIAAAELALIWLAAGPVWMQLWEKLSIHRRNGRTDATHVPEAFVAAALDVAVFESLAVFALCAMDGAHWLFSVVPHVFLLIVFMNLAHVYAY